MTNPASSSVPGYPDPDTMGDIALLLQRGEIPTNPMNQIPRINAQRQLVDKDGQVVGGGVATSRNRAVILGDSRVDQGVFGTGAGANSGMATRGWWVWLQGMSGNWWQLVQAAGVQGDTIANAVARFENAIPGELFGGTSAFGAQFGVSTYLPDWLFVELGINNIGAGQSLQAMTAEADQLIAKMEATGARIVWLNESPVGSATPSYGKAYFNRIRRWNDWLARRQATSNQLLVVDIFADAIDPASAAGHCKSNYMWDNAVHPGSFGARRRAELIWAAVQARWGVRRGVVLPTSRNDTYDAATAPDIANRISDPLCFGSTSAVSGTGNSGTLPSTYSASNCNNATVVYSVVPHPSGIGNCIQADVTFTAAGGFCQFNTERIEALCASGDVVRMGCEIFVYGLNDAGNAIEPLAAKHNLLTAKMQAFVVDGPGNRFFQTMQDGSNTEGVQIGDYNVTPITWPCQLIGPITRVQGQCYVLGAGAGKVRVLFGRFAGFVNGGPLG